MRIFSGNAKFDIAVEQSVNTEDEKECGNYIHLRLFVKEGGCIEIKGKLTGPGISLLGGTRSLTNDEKSNLDPEITGMEVCQQVKGYFELLEENETLREQVYSLEDQIQIPDY